jgi:hypothetical protein
VRVSAIIAAVVFAAHAVVGVGAAAVVIGAISATVVRWAGKACKRQAGEAVDVAAHGTYIMRSLILS